MTAGRLIHFIEWQFVFDVLSPAFWASDEFNVPATYALSVSLAVTVVINFWFALRIWNQDISFREVPLQTVTNGPTYLSFVINALLNPALNPAARGPKVERVAGLVISFVVLLPGLALPWIGGGYIRHSSAYLSVGCICGCLASVVINFVLTLLDRPMEIWGILGFLSVFVLGALVTYFVIILVERRRIALLDEIQADSNALAKVKSANHAINLAVSGFRAGHPMAFRWVVLQDAVERWPDSATLLNVYARFAAIWPSESGKLKEILQAASARGMHRLEKQLRSQIAGVFRLRMIECTPDVQSRLSELNRVAGPAQHQMRRVWDVIIEGNTRELGRVTDTAMAAIQSTMAEYEHAYRRYPNNLLIARAYSNFLLMTGTRPQHALELMDRCFELARISLSESDPVLDAGLAAFPALPRTTVPLGPENSMRTSQTRMIQDDTSRKEVEDRVPLSLRIDELAIPQISMVTAGHVLLAIVLVIVPAIVGVIVATSFVDSQARPLVFTQSVAEMMRISTRVPLYSIRLLAEDEGYLPVVDWSDQGEAPPSLGESWGTRDLMRNFLGDAMDILEHSFDLMAYNVGDNSLSRARDEIFDHVIEYVFHDATGRGTRREVTVMVGLIDEVMQMAAMVNETNPLVNASSIKTLFANYRKVLARVGTAAVLMSDHFYEAGESAAVIGRAVMIAVIVVMVVVWVLASVVTVLRINALKDEIYRSIATLPKDAIVKVADQTRNLGRESARSTPRGSLGIDARGRRASQEEEGLMKIVHTTGRGRGARFEAIMIVFCDIVIAAMAITATVLLERSLSRRMGAISQNAPHLVSVMGAFANALGGVAEFLRCALGQTAIRIDVDGVCDRGASEALFDRSSEFFYTFAYGGAEMDKSHFARFREVAEESRDSFNCTDLDGIPADSVSALRCLPPEVFLISLKGMTEMRYGLDFADVARFVNDLWRNLLTPLWHPFTETTFESISVAVNAQIDAEERQAWIDVAVLCGVVLLMLVFVIVLLDGVDCHVRDTLRLLLRCPVETILRAPRLVKILGGDFTPQGDIQKTLGAPFFDRVFEHWPEAMLITDERWVVSSANAACSKVFGDRTLRGLLVTQLLDDGKTTVEGPGDLIFADGQLRAKEVTRLRPGTDDHLNFELTDYRLQGLHVLEFRDITEQVRYARLIEDERRKSDELLARILPAGLVKRVASGETSISYLVPSASMLFADIVGFTPWCSQTPVAQVMATLDNMFGRLDEAMGKYPLVTKVKCIGDCYFCAGGIMEDQVRRSARTSDHATETVSFGFDVLTAMGELNAELGQGSDLKVRVGVHTGGPIVAGVVGVGRPAFEILGPAIAMAQQMEHHGLPMRVHVSQACAEALESDRFSFEDQRLIEVKGGAHVTTFFVELAQTRGLRRPRGTRVRSYVPGSFEAAMNCPP